MKTKILIAAAAVLAAGGVAVVRLCSRGGGDESPAAGERSAGGGKANPKTAKRVKGARPAKGGKAAPGRRAEAAGGVEIPARFVELERRREEFRKRGIILLDFEDPGFPLAPEERALAKKLIEVSARDDKAATIATAAQALRSKRVEVRSLAVRELGWIGKEALPELAVALADSDESVALDALTQFEHAIESIDNEAELAETVRLAMSSIKDKDSLETIAIHLHGLEPATAAATLADIVAGGGDAADVAKDTYKFISGEEWAGEAAAQEWAARRKAELESEITPEEMAAAKAAAAAAKGAANAPADPNAPTAPVAPAP